MKLTQNPQTIYQYIVICRNHTNRMMMMKIMKTHNAMAISRPILKLHSLILHGNISKSYLHDDEDENSKHP